MPRASSVQLVVPWAALGSLLAGNVLVLLMAEAGAFNFFTLSSPGTYTLLGLGIVLAVSGWPLRWVKVENVGEDGQRRVAYFRVASLIGRWRGGARRQCVRMREPGKKGNVVNT